VKIIVRVKPNARNNEVRPIAENTFLVRVTAPPVDGKANEMVIELLSEFFDKPKRLFSIIHGANSKEKIVEMQ